ncbi:transposase, partial [Acinetobacter indicus]|uniref:transposase n=1 Tax=Acinetobacter indicus TaxID=756892 RepID=UPI000ACB2BBB
KRNSPHDFHIRMPISARAKKLNPALGDYWEARLIEVEQAGKIRRYITSLLDSKTYPLIALAKLYAQRWEIEMCYREIKSNLQEGKHLRSKQPDLIYQELWGVLIAYNVLRRQMKYMAQRAKVSPLRISFHIASIALLNLLRFDSLASAGNLPKHLESLMEKSDRYVIPERRVRSYPRVVKGKPQKYPRKSQSIS